MYDRKVDDQTLTFAVSGKLWNRSLVMLDTQTNSLWSHILGRAMQGKLEGTNLKSLPSDMLAWGKWKQAHPETTVLDLKRSSSDYTKSAFELSDWFVIGFQGDDGFYHCSFGTMESSPLMNVEGGGLPLLITFDSESKSALLYDRRVGDRVLTFVPASAGKLRDEQTKSLWTRATGVATEGELAGRRLQPQVGVPSFRRAWMTFHPRSREVGR